MGSCGLLVHYMHQYFTRKYGFSVNCCKKTVSACFFSWSATKFHMEHGVF
jgi:hypothetical protein